MENYILTISWIFVALSIVLFLLSIFHGSKIGKNVDREKLKSKIDNLPTQANVINEVRNYSDVLTEKGKRINKQFYIILGISILIAIVGFILMKS